MKGKGIKGKGIKGKAIKGKGIKGKGIKGKGIKGKDDSILWHCCVYRLLQIPHRKQHSNNQITNNDTFVFAIL